MSEEEPPESDQKPLPAAPEEPRKRQPEVTITVHFSADSRGHNRTRRTERIPPHIERLQRDPSVRMALEHSRRMEEHLRSMGLTPRRLSELIEQSRYAHLSPAAAAVARHLSQRAEQFEAATKHLRRDEELYRRLYREASPLHELLTGHPRLDSLWETWDGHWRRALREAGTDVPQTALADVTRESVASQLASVEAVVGGLRAAGIIGRRPEIAERMLHPVLDHSRVASETLEMIRRATGEHERNALAAALTLINDQIERHSVALFPFITRPRDGARVQIRPLGRTSFEEQREELLSNREAVPADADYETSAELAPTAGMVDQSLALLDLIHRCNESSALKGREAIFKATSKSQHAASRLPLMVVRDREALEVFVDHLYFLVYEASGQAKRILQNDLMADGECHALWCVKHLRSKVFRHDIDHGSEGDIRKKYKAVSDSLARLGFQSLPHAPEDFKRLQKVLLDALAEMLNELAERVESAAAPSEKTDGK